MRKFLRMSMISFKALLGILDPKMYILYHVLNPALQMTFYTMLVRFVYKSEDITPWILGNAFILCANTAVFAIGRMLRNDREQGTLQMIVASPANKLYIYLARVFYNIVDAAFTIIIGLVIGVIFFDLDFSDTNLFVFALAIIEAIVGGMGIGLVLGSIALVISEIHLFLNVASMVIYILTGASFARERLPIFLYKLSEFVPITRSIEASRIIAAKGDLTDAIQLLGVDFAISVAYILLGFGLYGYFEYKARVKATLDAY